MFYRNLSPQAESRSFSRQNNFTEEEFSTALDLTLHLSILFCVLKAVSPSGVEGFLIRKNNFIEEEFLNLLNLKFGFNTNLFLLKIAYHPIYKHPLPEGHRFPMEKYELLPKQLLHEGTCTAANFFAPDPALDEDIVAVHTKDYLKNLKALKIDARATRKTGFPLSKELVQREILIAGGTIMASEFALKNGIAMSVAGGTHHAYSGHGEAFCLLNDQAIAARYLQKKKLAEKILIVDLDVHQGNGTAEIFGGDDSVYTFSMHGKNNYPFRKEISDLDIPLPDGTGDEEYLKILEATLPKLIKEQKPDFIFYLSGVDIISTDKLGKLKCTIEGCKERDRYVLQTCYDHRIPVQVSMGGGYSPEIKIIIEAHSNTYRLAQEIWF